MDHPSGDGSRISSWTMFQFNDQALNGQTLIHGRIVYKFKSKKSPTHQLCESCGVIIADRVYSATRTAYSRITPLIHHHHPLSTTSAEHHGVRQFISSKHGYRWTRCVSLETYSTARDHTYPRYVPFRGIRLADLPGVPGDMNLLFLDYVEDMDGIVWGDIPIHMRQNWI